ncbi:MAG: PilC/PilY family type IV pilus protein [Thermodesulfobacteriota bacterium]|nr:PilC/PilY family type IV pilus protein [Thermodesulfobacteriota bacterium]
MPKKILIICFIFSLVFISKNAGADDTDIFGGGVINIPPNVLIIFDNSGSMNEDAELIPSAHYDKDTSYPGPYNRSRVYYKYARWINWYNFQWIGDETVDPGEIACDSARNSLNENGHWQGPIHTWGSHTCGGYSYMLRTGNYRNFLDSLGVTDVKKIDLAKETIKDIIQTTDNVRFGIMIFNNEKGGHILAPIATRETQAEKDALKVLIDGIDADTWTPLAETLAEAGLYFARKPSWANSGGNYNTDFDYAIQWRCQKNYAIIMTDGESTKDKGDVLTRNDYINGKSIGDFDGDGNDPGSYPSDGSDYLDDVAKFLYDEDLLTGILYDSGGISFDDPNDSRFAKQNIITYTIGFDINNTLLSETADSSHGQGDYYTTEATGGGGVSLSDIFQNIIGSILETSSEFVAPVVPVSRMNKTYAGNCVYLGIFSLDSSGLWKGNLKKFGLSECGYLLDRDGNLATDLSGAIKEGAHSCWFLVDGLEGMEVEKGGAGQVLLTQASRYFYTYNTGTTLTALDKNHITPSDLGLTTTSERDDLIDFVRAEGDYDPDGGGDNARPWVLGDILHSRPAVLYDDSNYKNVIFVGANDGFLHCFVDDDKGTYDDLTDDTVEEIWTFIPWNLLPELQFLRDGSAHDCFVDGTPIVYTTGNNTYIVFGLRRGGDKYYTLDVSNYASPSFVWEVAPNILGTESLGQSWSTPHFCTIKESGGNTRDVLLLTGGYDSNQDNVDPGASDSEARAVYAVDAATGALCTNLNFNHATYANMQYCIVDLTSFDNDGDGYEGTIYAGSLGGNLFVFNDRDEDGTWDARRLFSAGNSGTDKLKKFFNSPGVVQETFGDYVYIGTGDREDPQRTTVVNQFYAIKNTWPATWDDSSDTLTPSTLVNVTSDILQDPTKTEAEKDAVRAALAAGSGWYINLENSGEKVVSSPLVFNKVVYFTTFTPSADTGSSDDLCSLGYGSGIARLYAIDYKTGNAVFDFTEDDQLTKTDRSINIGSGIPSQPVIVVTKTGVHVIVGTEGGVFSQTITPDQNIFRYYWKQN